MPDLSPTIDGNLLKVGNTWAGTVGDGTSATSVNTTNTYRNSGINAIDLTAFNTTQVERCIFEFNTSGITATPSSATFKVYGKHSDTASVIGVQCTLASNGAIVAGDWDSWNESSPVTYTNKINAGDWNSNGYNTFTLTAAALSAMVSLDYFQIMLLEADNDYDQTSAGSGLSKSAGLYFEDDTSASRRPVLSYEEEAVVVDPGEKFKTKVTGGNLQVIGGKVEIGR